MVSEVKPKKLGANALDRLPQFCQFNCMKVLSQTKSAISFAFAILLLAATSLTSQAQIVWSIGRDDNAQPENLRGGGTNAAFVRETGSVNPLPGSPFNVPTVPPSQSADNDYYLAGLYSTVIPGVTATYGAYVPVGNVSTNEEAAERAFVPGDQDLRYHFNLPGTLQPTDLLSVTFDAFSLDTAGPDPRWGIEVYFNGVLVQPEIVIRPAQLDVDYTTPAFTLASVDARVGPGFDNIVSLKGTHYGSGDWMGIDYVQLNAPTVVIPPAVFPWGVGKDDNGHPLGNGGGTNASFVQGNGTVNSLPGSPFSPEVDGQADNDYYFAGSYTTNISSVVTNYGPYVPVGLVSTNEEAAERSLADNDNELRYHFNLPNSATPATLASVSFDPLDLDTSGVDPRYGVEVYFNGIRIQPQKIFRPAQLGQKFTTLPFKLGDYNARTGPGFDNIVSLKGISYSAQGGGTFVSLDYVQLNLETNAVPPGVLPVAVGRNDNAYTGGDGGGTNATFVEPNGTSNPLPGDPNSLEADFEADDDYYFAGAYAIVLPGNGVYDPVGLVSTNEEATARSLTADDNEFRFHFNLPATLQSNDVLSLTWEPLELDLNGANPRYGVEIYFNNILIQTQMIVRVANLTQAVTTARFTPASVNAQAGPGFDNIIRVKGFNFGDGGYSLSFDYFQLNPHPNSPFPWMVGRNDNGWPAGDGGGPNTSFVQENGGINPLPGRPNNPEVNQQNDNDYYFAGDYTTTIPSVVARYGAYTPIGSVLSNEEGAERAFAGGDLDLRYHFNLPTTLNSNDTLSVTYEPLNLDDSGAPDVNLRRFGVEVYFNGVLVQTQIVVRPPQLTVGITTPEFTLASVNAQLGPGYDNILSLKGISYNAEGGGNWMGIDYVQLNGPPAPALPRFLPTVRTNNQIVLNWTGGGALEWAPTVFGPWTPITPVPTPPYSEAIVSSTNRFFRLKK